MDETNRVLGCGSRDSDGNQGLGIGLLLPEPTIHRLNADPVLISKILFWDRAGWWLCNRRLEEGTFAWPKSGQGSIELSAEELTLLLGGIDLERTKKRKWRGT